MNWKTVRLELARTREFPNGSAARAYLLRLPLEPCGAIDEVLVQQHPERATVRRHWPNQADCDGYLVRRPSGWAFSYALGAEVDESLCHLDAANFEIGAQVQVLEVNGERLPYRVASCAG